MSLRIIMKRASAQVSDEQCSEVLSSLQRKGLKLLFTSANRAYFEALGMGEESTSFAPKSPLSTGQRYTSGDLIPADDWTELVYVGRYSAAPTQSLTGLNLSTAMTMMPVESYLEIGAIHRDASSKLFDLVQQTISECLGLKDNGDEAWSGLMWTNKAFDNLQAAGSSTEPDFQVRDRTVAAELSCAEIRKLCRAVKAAGSILVRDFPRVGGTVEACTKLEQLELMAIQHVLMCKKNSNMVLQVADLDRLPELDLQGVRCPSCGRKPSEERAEQVLVPTEICKNLLDHSKWMAVTLTSALENLGINSIEYYWNIRKGPRKLTHSLMLRASFCSLN